jgi:hypothetical protein
MATVLPNKSSQRWFLYSAAGLVIAGVIASRFTGGKGASPDRHSAIATAEPRTSAKETADPIRESASATTMPAQPAEFGAEANDMAMADPAPDEIAPEPVVEERKRTPDELLAALNTTDAEKLVEAVDEIVEQKVAAALPRLLSMNIHAAPDATQTVVHAIAALASEGSPRDRQSASSHLVELLKQEQARRSADDSGNALAIYEALGEVNDPSAARTLEQELLAPSLPHDTKSVIVASLARLHQPSSAEPLRALREQIKAFQGAEPSENETRDELAQAIDGALSQL